MKVGERRKESISWLCKELHRAAKRKQKKVRGRLLAKDAALSKHKAHLGRIIADVTLAATQAYNESARALA